MKKVEQAKTRKKISVKASARLIAIALIALALIIGIIFSASSFSSSYVLGQDFSDKYQAWVGVYNSKADPRPDDDNQPTGDATKGAQILAERLNPLGMKDLRISQAGANYLQVSAAANSYNNIEEFSNSIQRSGSVIMTDDTFTDIQLTAGDNDTATKRTPMSDYFTSANAVTRTSGSNKYPYISYGLNGSTFQDLVTSKTAAGEDGQAATFNLYIFTDLDEFFNDVRTYFNFDKSSDIDDRYDNFYRYVLSPLQEIFNKQDNSEEGIAVKNMLYDLFAGSYTSKNASNGESKTMYGSLIDNYNFSVQPDDKLPGRKPTSGSNLEDIFSANYGFSYISKTSNYVYSGDAKDEDFAEGGRYADDLTIWGFNDKTVAKTNISVQNAFSTLSKTLIPAMLSNNKNTDVANYFGTNYVLFGGAVSTDSTETDNSFFKDNNFYTRMETQSKAKIDASIFNAASEGYSFVSSSVTRVNSPITNTELIIAMVILLILATALFVLMVILYRLLALFTVVIAVTSVILTLLIMSKFGLTIGLETVLGAIILIAISFETASMLFGILRHNFFNKKRGLKTSFKIAAKEAAGFGIDLSMTILITSLCMFWIGTNTIKSLATMLSIGAALSIVFAVIVFLIWLTLIFNTNVFEKYKWLLLINIDPNSSFALQEYKISSLTTRRDLVAEHSGNALAIDNKIKKLEESLSKKKNKQEEILEKIDQKQIVKIDARIKKLEARLTAIKAIKQSEKDIKAHDARIAKLESAITAIKASIAKLDVEKDNKKINKLNTKMAKLERKLAITKLESGVSAKNAKRIHRLEVKLDDLHYMHSSEGKEIRATIDEVSDEAYSTTEKRRIKQNERAMKIGARVLLAVFVAFAALFAIIMPTVGAKLDQSFGGAVTYTVWGDTYIYSSENVVQSAFDEPITEKYKNMASDLLDQFKISSASGSVDADKIKTAKMFGDFLIYTLEHQEIYGNKLYGQANIPNGVHFSFTSGINYINNTSSSVNDSSGMWVSVEATVPDTKGSRQIKQVISTLLANRTETTPVGSDGFTSKRSHPYTNKKMLVQAVIVGALAIAILFIYIIIRFKWTYYVALALASIFAFAMVVISIVIFRIDVDMSTITLGIIGFAISIYLGMYVISSIRSIMNRKNEKSLTVFFEKEINVSVEIRKERREVREEIYRKRQAMKVEMKLRKEEISVNEKLNMKAEFKTFVRAQHDTLKTFVRTKREEVRRESRRNNYLYEVVSEVFTKLWKKLLILCVVAVTITIALIVGLTGNWSNSFVFIISFVISSLTCLFIMIPLWVVIERFRIHNRLASKRFINQIVVSQEEQLVEDIND